MLTPRFSLFGSGVSSNKVNNNISNPDDALKTEVSPTIKMQLDKDVYRPGDSVFVTIDISYPSNTETTTLLSSSSCSLLIERLGFEIKGIEKLDPQWFSTHKPLPGSAHSRGEHVFMVSSIPSLVSNQILSSAASKSYVVRVELPSILPPTFRGSTIRYFYYVKGTLCGRWLTLENGHSHRESSKDLIELDARVPLNIWVTQKSNGLLMEEDQSDGIVPATTLQLDVYWKAMDGDSEWARVNDNDDGVEEGYDSSRDEISSVSSYNPSKESMHRTFGSSLSLQSFAARTSLSSNVGFPRLSVAEVLHDPSADVSSQQQNIVKPQTEDVVGESSAHGIGTNEASASEGFIRGRSYNIRMDDQVLLRFSPKNSDSNYYFSDMIGGTLTFFHEEGCRRCLEVSITLEISETISRRFVHSSRRNAPIITKVQSDHHEVVADLVQTSFLFSVPLDGPMSFSTPHVSVQWALRFEFYTTPKNVDWTRYEHPLLVEGRDKSEWVLPITVHAPPPGALAAHTRDAKHFSLEPLWVRT
ncbi:uncharacterized protein LOC8258066 [Ricinus communis]|uniref:Uncharacterized protein n=1 Tax=Ricinus communis TaxID=3988 RepID=B9RWY2_RICCO|nr:uncharacterized protein LOC8258066 [Ricinus communis]XP_048227916.1 uncharacterized protein LOC8258066 [Ricinus communis]EEF44137.1 conserved hypothetical protein [Ricinus communis]|eukprot:XP_015574151.1 uncharacterized protein LOC8258066 [Ricinus communis]